MKIYIITSLIVLIAISNVAVADDVITPSKISKEDISGKIFERETIVTTHHGGSTQLDAQTLEGKDRKFESGMYQSGPIRQVIQEPYGVDEFMYFIKGSVTLTSSDGSVQTINAGEAVSIPKEWTGIWQTEGYTKFYAIYYPEGLPE
jgi:uncharacterized cupin superfamily protein